MAKLLSIEQQEKVKDFRYDEILIVALCQTEYDQIGRDAD